MRDLERLALTLRAVFTGPPLPKVREVRQVFAVERLLGGAPADVVAKEFRLQRRGLEALAAAVRAQGLAGLAWGTQEITEPELARCRLGIARILLGELAERRFELVIQEVTGGGLLRIEDHRPSRTDTDYRLLNGRDDPICRFNIKFHGSLFRDARRFVGLDPDDCFALATYKINNASRRQEEDRLPYVFLVLSNPDLAAADVGRLVPDDYVWALAALAGKMAVEEAIVARLRQPEHLSAFQPIFAKMPAGQFRVISAAKALRLLKEKLFDRVHALSLKGFTRKFRNAEVDMHFSLSQELTPVQYLLELMIKESPQKVAVRLYNGDY